MSRIDALLTGAIVALLLVGCEKRDRSNPFDPMNPNTGGVPELLDARAGNRHVDLEWNLGGVSGIQRVFLYRRVAPSGPELLLTQGGLDSEVARYVDGSAQNGVAYEYRLELLSSSGVGRSTAWDPATPGRSIPWVADADGGGLFRLTPDGRDLVRRVDPGRWFLDLAADTVTGTIWSAEYLDGYLYHHDAVGTRLLRVSVDGARAVALSRDGASVWVASFRDGRIRRFLNDGSEAWVAVTGAHIEDLLPATDGALWSAGWFDAGTGEVRVYRDDSDQPDRIIGGFERPVALAQPDRDRIAVLDRLDRRISSFDLDGNGISISGEIFVDPVDLCTDGSLGLWVADPGRAGIVHVGTNLEETGFISLPKILGVTYDPSGEGVWAAGEGAVHRLDHDGGVLSTLGVGGRPVKVELLYDREAR